MHKVTSQVSLKRFRDEKVPSMGSDNEVSVDHIDDSSSDALSEEGSDKDRRLAKMAKAIRTIIEVRWSIVIYAHSPPLVI